MHRPRDSVGGSTDRHYSTIHSVTQSYVTKAFHLQAHCGNPAILIAAARYPLQSLLPMGVLGRPRSPHSAPPPALSLSLWPPRGPPPANPTSSAYRELRIFPVLRIPLSYGSVLRSQQSTPRFRPRVPCANSSRASGCFQTLARGRRSLPPLSTPSPPRPCPPKERLKCSWVQEMFFKHAICQVTLNVAKQ